MKKQKPFEIVLPLPDYLKRPADYFRIAVGIPRGYKIDPAKKPKDPK